MNTHRFISNPALMLLTAARQFLALSKRSDVRFGSNLRSGAVVLESLFHPLITDIGATVFELMAWHGWKTIAEAQRYVEEANRIRLAESAGAKVISGTAIGPPISPVGQNDDQTIEITGGGK
jgi:hypothetical protein